MNTLAIGSRIKDCSQGFCSFYCPQWCYIIFPPPPPPLEDFSDDGSSGPNFSPLIITIIGFLAGALLLLSYYAILSNYCSSRFSTTRRDRTQHDVDVETGESSGPGAHEPWFVATNGLDEALVRSMATFKYRRREGLVEGTECSVCLSEFVEDERLKLLPKCSHAFHVICIDTWLKCHSNCPLCRANVAGPTTSAPPSLPPLHSSGGDRVENSGAGENSELGGRDQELEQVSLNALKMATSGGESNRRMRRSVSMDCVFESRLLIEEEGNRQSRSRELECEMRPSELRRSHSSGRWFVTK